MRRIFIKKHIFLLWIAIWFPQPLWCGEELPEIRQITTHPQMDFSPCVSPDGRWLAFTSERSGNLDIWVKRLPRGRAVQVTTHRAEDSQPAWSPDGKHLAFVSKRRDAQGDIWLVHLDLRRGGIPKGRPDQLTHYLGLDRKPSFSPNGKKIVFSSDRDGMLNLWVMGVKSSKARQLTITGGTDPAWSPKGDWILFTSFRADAGGDLFLIHAKKPEISNLEERRVYPVTWGRALDRQGTWSPDGIEIVFNRINQDGDGDGRVTPRDNSSLWQKKLVETGKVSPDKIALGKSEIQITTSLYLNKEPCWSSSVGIMFTSNRGRGMDIWSIPSEGIFQRASSADEQYGMVLERFAAATTEEALLQANLGYRRIQNYFPGDSVWVARSLIRIGENLQVLGKQEEARDIFGAIKKVYASQKREVVRAEIQMASHPGDSLDVRIERCLRVIEFFSEEPQLVAEAWIVLGDLYRETGEKGQSLAAYSEVVQSFPELRNRKAQAQLRIGDLLREEGQEETAKKSYLSVLREFGDVPLWRMRAGERLLDQIRGSPYEKIRGYQQIIQQARDLPSLVAEAQLFIGRVLMEQEHYEQALLELERVEEIVPELRWAHAEAKILIAKVYGARGDQLKGILLLENVIHEYASLEGGRYALKAKEELFDLLFDSAERLKALGDFTLASARYQKALNLRADDIRIHRGLVEAMFRSGRIDELIQKYEKQLEVQPKDPILLYGLGLCFSYRGERSPEFLRRSNAFLIQALAEDYRLIHPYRTLSFNYELLEKLADVRRQRKRGFFVRFGRTVIAPLRWLVGLLPFGGQEGEVGYYEKAIDALTTAVELNDENRDPYMEALLVQNLANNFYNLGEFGYKKAYQYFGTRLSLDSTFKHPLEKAVFYERAGHSGVVVGDVENATTYLQTAIGLFTDLGREEDALRNQKMLAFLYQLAQKYEDAIYIYEKTVVQDERAGRWDEVERGYRNIAYNYHLMEEPEDALRYARRAEEILHRKELDIGPPKKSSLRIEFLGFSIPVWGMEEIGGASAEGFSTADEVALVYGLISRNLEAMKSFQEAVQYEKKRLEIFEKRKDKLAQRVAYNRLGRLYYKMAMYEEAWDFFYLSWRESKKVKGEDQIGRKLNAINLGNVAIVELSLLDQEQHVEQAKKCLEEELEKLGEEPNVFRRERLVLVSLLGTLWTQQGKRVGKAGKGLDTELKTTLNRMNVLARAEEYFQEGLRLAREGKYWREEGILLKNLAEVAEIARDDVAAYDRLQESYRVMKKGGDENYLWRIEYGIANLLRLLSPEERNWVGETHGSLFYYERAIDRLEALPVQEEDSEEWLSDRNDRWNLYVDAAFEFARQGRGEEALEIVERGRQKEVADLLARRPPRLKRERHKIAWGNLRYVRSRLQEIRKNIIEEEIGENRAHLLDEWSGERERYEKEYRKLLEEIRDEDRVLAYLSGAETVNLREVRSILTSDGGALVYLLGPDQTLLWTIDGDSIQLTVLPMGRAYFQNIVPIFVQRVEKDSLVEEICQDLYDVLLRPVASFVEGKVSVIIVPDGPLWNLPFGVLSDEGEILLEKTTVHYTPNLTAYSLAWERRKINQENGILVGDVRDQTYLVSMEKATKKENILLESQATEKTFNKTALTSDIIQVERWVLYNDKDPLTSALVLFSGEGEDGFLRIEELFSWDLKASLFFLPSHRGEVEMERWGTLSFIYGLLYAGVPTVGLPLWPVNRDVKKTFFDSFYEQIGEFSVADAFVEAQLTVREQYPAVQDWGGFTLVGFAGMYPEERIRFAEDNLLNTVLRGRAYEQKGEYTDAVMAFESALSMAEAMRDSVTVQRVYNEIIRGCIGGKLYEKAILYQGRVLEEAKKLGDTEGIISSLKNLVAFTMRSGDFEEAASVKIEYIDLIKEESSVEEIASSYEELSFIYTADRKYDEAVDWAERAYQVYEKGGNLLGQGRSLIWKGRFYLEGDDYWASRRDLSEGIALLESFLDTFPTTDEKTKAQLASGTQLLGIVFEKLSQYKEALKFQKKGLTLFAELGKLTQEAQGYQYLANLYWKTGDYRRALSNQKKALEAFKSLGNKKLLAMAYSTHGLIQMSLGDLSKAREAEQTALDLSEEIDSKADQATILKNLGLISIVEGDLTLAYDYFRQASFIDSSLGFKRGLAYDTRNLGTLLVQLDRPREGVSLLKRGLHLSQNLGDMRNVVQCYYGLGQAYALIGDRKTAVAVLDSGIVEASDLVVPELLWRLYRQRANVQALMGREKEALKDYQKAVDIVETLRAELKVEAFKQGFLDDKMDLYVDVVRHLLEMNRAEEAFNFVERAKSRNFIDMLGNQSLRLTEVQDELLNRVREARMALQEAQDHLARLALNKGIITSEQKAEREHWKDLLDERRRLYEDVLVSVQSENPELASFVSVDPWSAEKIEEILPDSTALIEYFVTQDALFCWVLLPGKIVGNKIDVREEQILKSVSQFRKTIQAYLSADRESRELYQWLVAPVEKEILGLRHLVIVPHGALHYLPFAALQDQEGTYLVERFSVSLVPSATVLGYCMEKGDKIKKDKDEKNVFALANPDLGSPFYDLPFAEKEVQSLSRTYENVTAFVGREATEKRVRQQIGNFSMIHFACHGTYESGTPLFSALLLSPAGEDDGRLEAHEIFGLKLDGNLVTLSACETGLGQITRGDEIIGLARSFIFAGAPSIITSLWKVDDLATAVMVKRFYRYLNAGFSRSEALRKAQLLVKEAVNDHPAAWAAFGLTGDFR